MILHSSNLWGFPSESRASIRVQNGLGTKWTEQVLSRTWGAARGCVDSRGEKKAMAKCVAFQFTAQTCRSLHLFQHCVFNLHMKITERAEGKDWCKHRLTYMFLLGVRPSKAQTEAGKPFTAAAHRNYAEREHTRTCKTAAVADFKRGNVWHASLISRKHV